jgi:hypothetical protein
MIEARSRALEFKPFLIGHTQHVEVKEEDQLKKNSQFELNNKTYHNLLTGLIISDIDKKSVLGTPSNLELILEHITNLAEIQIISIYTTATTKSEIWYQYI